MLKLELPHTHTHRLSAPRVWRTLLGATDWSHRFDWSHRLTNLTIDQSMSWVVRLVIESGH